MQRKEKIINLQHLTSAKERALWIAFVETYGEYREKEKQVHVTVIKDAAFPVEIYNPEGEKDSFNVSFNTGGNQYLNYAFEAVENKELKGEERTRLIRQRYFLHGEENLQENKIYVLRDKNDLKYVYNSLSAVLIDPIALPDDGKKLFKHILETKPDVAEIQAGEIFTGEDGKNYVFVRDLGRYTKNKPGHRFGVFGKFKGKGKFGRVNLVDGKLKENEGEFKFKFPEKKDASDKQSTRYVVKRQVHQNERSVKTTRNECEILCRARMKARLTEYKNEDGHFVTLLYIEKARGRSLDDYLYDGEDKKKELDFVDALLLCEAISLDFSERIEKTNIIHQDIKPANIMIKPTGRKRTKPLISIIDYGLSQFQETMKSKSCGTPEYIAPEVFAQAPYDSKADIFSLGMVLAEVLGIKDRDFLRQACREKKAELLQMIKDRKINFKEEDLTNALAYDQYFSEAAVAKNDKLKKYGIQLFAGIRNVDPAHKKQIEDFIVKRMLSVNPKERPSGQETHEFFRTIRESKPQQQFAKDFLEKILEFDDHVRTVNIFGHQIGGKKVSIMLDNQNPDYLLPYGMAQMVDAYKDYVSSPRQQSDFIAFIERCIMHAGHGYTRGQTTLWSGQWSDVSAFYMRTFTGLANQVKEELEIDIQPDFVALRKSL